MRAHSLIATSLIILSGIADAETSEISVKALSANSYELTLKTRSMGDVTLAQNQLLPKVLELCGSLQAEFGRYKFESVEEISDRGASVPQSFYFAQNVSCVSALSSATKPTESQAARLESPTESEKTSLERAAQRYLTSRSEGPYADAYSYLSEFLKGGATFEQWSADAMATHKRRGPITQITIKKITWYKNPPSAPKPGLYAASDYSSQFQDGSYVCGYLAWYQKTDGSFEVIREEAGVLEAANVARMAGSQLEAVMSRFGC